MLDFLALAVAIFTFVILFQFRSILSFTLHRISAIKSADPPADSIVDLLTPLQAEIEKLGFAGPTQLQFTEKSGPAEFTSRVSLFTNPEKHSIFWCHTPINILEPNQLVTYWTTQLQDGRVVFSQVYDPYFELVSTALTPAQTLSEPDPAKQFRLHLDFVAKFNVEASLDSASDEGMLYQASTIRNDNLQQLIKSGRANTDKQGVNRVSLGMAFKILRLLFTRKKPEHKPIPIPTSRLLALAQQTKIIRERTPNIAIQLGVFAVSILLSIFIGALIWDVEIALIILGVVLFHEAGHYLAMRLLGYRNVQIMALPLVGGVTIGYNNSPNAWHQAWMSLMGPLPGIILAWGLLIGSLFFSVPVFNSDSLMPLIVVLLLINYLNILPVLPLDGGHVLQSLLPPNRLIIKAVITLLTCCIGAAIAFYFEFYLLTLLALLQMLTLPGQFKMAKLVARLYEKHEINTTASHDEQLLNILTAQQDYLGTCSNAQKRITQAETILQTLTTLPMKTWQRGLVGILFSMLLIVPISAILLGFGVGFGNQYDADSWEKQETARASRQLSYKQQMQSISSKQLVDDINRSKQFLLNKPAANKQNLSSQKHTITAALSISLPKQLRDLYTADINPADLNIMPETRVNQAKQLIKDNFAMLSDNEQISVFDGQNDNNQEQFFSKQELGEWFLISSPDIKYHYLLLEPDNENGQGRMLDMWLDYAEIYPSLRAWLEQQWIETQETHFQHNRQQAAYQTQYRHLQTQDAMQLLELYKKTFELPFYYQWMAELISNSAGQPDMWSAPATENEITATEQRLGIELPVSLKSVYYQHNGLKSLMLSSVEELDWIEKQRFLDKFGPLNNKWQKLMADGSLSNYSVNPDHLTACISLGAYNRCNPETNATINEPTLLWCPDEPQYALLELSTGLVYENFISWLRYKIALFTIHDSTF